MNALVTPEEWRLVENSMRDAEALALVTVLREIANVKGLTYEEVREQWEKRTLVPS